ncbi:MAG TPA: maleylpyruvate isomerase family mycothiol-dependent enzyme [Acidimicrobiales bacterium]|jgi:uncharacterized protein (TIGR03083 family)|nr:maleylpyruvate isomerase family mycothiol-dependent enzyme [Acidimicrobiales bacterium]
MTSSSFDPLATIAIHSAGLTDAAEGRLDARIEHCPAWSMADLVWHVADVQWFWATIAAEQLSAPPDDSRRPLRPGGDAELLAASRASARRLVEVLGEADPAAPCWTWAPGQNDVGFIVRHQVQEAAVHHWDAANAVGAPSEIATAAAADAIDEFLTFSVSTDDDPAEPERESLGGSFAIVCSDAEASWIVGEGEGAGTVRVASSQEPALAGVTGTACDLLLWLYGRKDLEIDPAAEDVVRRFLAMRFTD